jgi:hypothetical protein
MASCESLWLVRGGVEMPLSGAGDINLLLGVVLLLLLPVLVLDVFFFFLHPFSSLLPRFPWLLQSAKFHRRQSNELHKIE